MKSNDELIRLIEAIYQASLHEGDWKKIIMDLSTHMGAVGGAMIDIQNDMGVPLKVISEGLNDTADDFALRMFRIDPRLKHTLPIHTKHTLGDYAFTNEEEMRRSEFYDWLDRVCGTKYFIGSRLSTTDPVTSLVAISYAPEHGHPSQEQIDYFHLLSPHIGNAWQVTRLRAKADAATHFADMVTKTLPWGLAGLDGKGKCIALNEKAEAIFGLNDGLLLNEGNIRSQYAAVDRTLQKLIDQVLRTNMGQGFSAGAALAIPRPSKRPDFALQIIPGMNRGNDVDPNYPSVLIVISDPSEPATIDIHQLRTLYGLTEREGELVGWMLTGCSLPEAAREMGVAHQTTRVHLQNVFHKTHTSSQPELINRLRSLFPIQIGPQS